MSIPSLPQIEPSQQSGACPLQQSSVSVLSSSLSSSSAPKTIEESNRAFFARHGNSLPITYYIPTVQCNPGLTPAQQKIITDTFKLCRELPQGNDQKTLSEVRSHYDMLIHTSNLVAELQKNSDFFLHKLDHFDLKYRLAQSYTHLGSFDSAVKLLDVIISEIAQTECKLSGKDWDHQYLPFWNRAITLRASILSSPGTVLRSHNPINLSPEMKQRFLVDYYRAMAPLIMKRKPEDAIKMYEKAFKLEPNREVFNILLECYGKQKADASSKNLIATRTALLEKMIDLVSSYKDWQSKETLPRLRNELFECYCIYGKNCLKNNRFESAIASFESALDSVEREGALVDPKTLNGLKIDLFNTFVVWSKKLENQGFIASASSAIMEALAFQRTHLLNIAGDELEGLFKRNQELAAKANLNQT